MPFPIDSGFGRVGSPDATSRAFRIGAEGMASIGLVNTGSGYAEMAGTAEGDVFIAAQSTLPIQGTVNVGTVNNVAASEAFPVLGELGFGAINALTFTELIPIPAVGAGRYFTITNDTDVPIYMKFGVVPGPPHFRIKEGACLCIDIKANYLVATGSTTVMYVSALGTTGEVYGTMVSGES